MCVYFMYDFNNKYIAWFSVYDVHRQSVAGYNSKSSLSPCLQLLGAYSVSKTALLGLCKVMAKSCAPKNVRVNAVAPGIVKTKLSEAVRLCFTYYC